MRLARDRPTPPTVGDQCRAFHSRKLPGMASGNRPSTGARGRSIKQRAKTSGPTFRGAGRLFVARKTLSASRHLPLPISTAAAAGLGSAAGLAADRLAAAVLVAVVMTVAARLGAAGRRRSAADRLAAAMVPVAVVMTMAARLLATTRRSSAARGLGSAGRFGSGTGRLGGGAGRFGGGARRFSGSAATTTSIEREQPRLGLGRGEAEQTDHQQGGQQSTEFHGFDSSTVNSRHLVGVKSSPAVPQAMLPVVSNFALLALALSPPSMYGGDCDRSLQSCFRLREGVLNAHTRASPARSVR